MFFSDELEHEVLPNYREDPEAHRYTYTIWLVGEQEEEKEQEEKRTPHKE